MTSVRTCDSSMVTSVSRVGLLLVPRLLRTSACGPLGVTRTRGRRALSASPASCKEDEGDRPETSGPSPGRALRSRRRRPLSPLERISSLLPQDALSSEVRQLREQSLQDPEGGGVQVSVTPEDRGQEDGGQGDNRGQEDGGQEDTQVDRGQEEQDASEAPQDGSGSGSGSGSAPLPGESWLSYGELLVAEHRKKGELEYKKMFQLKEGAKLQSNWGVIPHGDMAGGPAGRILKTHLGFSILIRRAYLEDYVLHMRRGPAIAYPKDAAAMLMMMDVSEGDCVLESGSGSGAMSLFLSRAVGSKGSVLSVEVREDHLKKAVQNYKRWRASWSLRRGEEWPDNVQFHNADLGSASSLLAGRGFHAVALDLISPHLVLPSVIPHLHPGAVCAVYLANITQVIDLLEGIRCLGLPLLCERIVDLPIRDWLVAPALRKDGSYCVRKVPILDEDQGEEGESDKEETTTRGDPAFGSIPYIGRPHPVQLSHTAFLVKLRKSVK